MEYYQHESRLIAKTAHAKLMNLKLGGHNVSDLDKYITRIRTLISRSKAGEDLIPGGLILELIMNQVKDILALNAVLAEFYARELDVQTWESLLETLDAYIARERARYEIFMGPDAKGRLSSGTIFSGPRI